MIDIFAPQPDSQKCPSVYGISGLSKPAIFSPGDTLTSYILGAPAYEAETGKELGIRLQRTGILEVESVNGTRVTALVVDAVTSIDKGQLVTQ